MAGESYSRAYGVSVILHVGVPEAHLSSLSRVGYCTQAACVLSRYPAPRVTEMNPGVWEVRAVLSWNVIGFCQAMVSCHMLSELEEVIQYKLVPERREIIRQIWWERLQVSLVESPGGPAPPPSPHVPQHLLPASSPAGWLQSKTLKGFSPEPLAVRLTDFPASFYPSL